MINKDEVRKHFTYLNNGMIYFNHASTGPIPDFTVKAINKYLEQRSEDSIDNYNEILAITKETKELVAKFINTTSDRIAFVDNVSNAMNLLAQGLQWNKDDEIILFDIEFPANVYPFLNLEKQGVKVKILPTKNGKIIFDEIRKNITDKTKLLSISHIQFLSGYRADLEQIGKLCKENGIIFAVDAIQSFGVVNIDVQRMNIDFLASGIQKWFLGLEGTTIVYVSKELQDKINQKYVGWLSVKDAWNILDYKLELDETAHRFENGTLNYAGIVSLNPNIKFFISLGINEIEKEIIENTKYLINLLETDQFYFLFKPDKDYQMSGIVSIKVDNPENVFQQLKQRKIHISVREGYLRFSPHFYNTREEIETVVKNLKEITNKS
ncbi:MAG: aminotransferase class V-fold PLP-dependent enzyme [Ignavibacteria bacterium]|nr:aminotransferase class V-fold PLP-dependent enzyme [Ignavibacteria bacterium]